MPRFISYNVRFDSSAKVYVGGGTTIADSTIILTHDYSVDYGLIAVGETRSHEYKYCKDVHIGENTFIGQRCIILPGVAIGNNCVIGAGALVSRDIPDNSVAAGMPAHVIETTDNWIKKRLVRDKDYII